MFIVSILYVIYMREKSITVREDQAEWIEENYLNLSRFVQGKLDELMSDNNGKTRNME